MALRAFDLPKSIKFINADITPKKREEASAQFLTSYLTLYVTCVVFLDENWSFLTLKFISAYDITEFLRTAYQPFAYCVASKKPEYCVPKGGCHPHL